MSEIGSFADKSVFFNTIPENFDCLNKYNDYSEDGNSLTKFRYKSDGSTLGGEGKNISYKFIIERDSDVVIDASEVYDIPNTSLPSSSHNKVENESDDGFKYYNKLLDPPIKGGYLSNYSHPENASNKKTIPIDEVERYGIQFIENATGKKSFVKWIGDIRSPSPIEYNPNAVNSENHLHIPVWDGKPGIIKLEFTVNNVPAGYSWRIVRVPKTKEIDYSNKMYGFLSSAFSGSDNEFRHPFSPMINDSIYTTDYSNTDINDWLGQFVSPDFLMAGKFNMPSQAYFKLQGRYSSRFHGLMGNTSVDHRNQFIDKFRSLQSPRMTEDTYLNGGYWLHKMGITQSWYCKAADTKEASELISGIDGLSNPYRHYAEKGADRAVKGTSITVRTGLQRFKTSGAIDCDWGELPFVSLKINNEYSRYGGRTYYDRKYNIYEPISEFKSSTGTSIVYGDHFIDFFEYMNVLLKNEAKDNNSWQNIVLFPVVSRYNPAMMVNKRAYQSDIKSSSVLALRETKQVSDFEGGNEIVTQDFDLYTYNNVYSRNSSIEKCLPKPFDYRDQKEFPTRIYHSKHKINGEYGDSWIEFMPNKSIDLESKYGTIKKLSKFKDRMYFFQENAFGTLYINERETQASRSGSIVMAKSGVLDGFRELDSDSGIQDQKHQVNSANYIYWFDMNKKQFKRFSGERPENIGKIKGMNSYFKTITEDDDVIVSYNSDFNEIFIHKNSEILVFSEDMNMFTLFIDSGNVSNYLTTKDNDLFEITGNEVYLSDKGNKSQMFGSYKNPSVTLLFSPLQGDVFTLDSLEILAQYFIDTYGNSKDSNAINSIEISNDYQSTGVISDLTKFKQRFRKWRFNSLRDYQNGNKNRLNDYYSKIKITFKSGSNYKIHLHNIIYYFRQHNP